MTDLRLAPAARTHIPVKAALLTFGAGILWSIGAVTTRAAEGADVWQYLLWRSIAIIVVMELFVGMRSHRSTLLDAYTSGWRMIGACLSLLTASVAFIYALKTTSVANTVFLASVTPLVAVFLARLFLGERLRPVTVGAIAMALMGLAITVVGDIGAGRMSGNLAAMASSVGFASYTVFIRADPTRSWAPVMPGYASMMIVICSVITLAGDRSLFPSGRDIGLAVVHGGLLIVVGTWMFNVASRSIPAVAMTVLAQSETAFAPVWVFFAFGERPGLQTLVGASIILAAVLGQALFDARPGELRPHREVPGVLD